MLVNKRLYELLFNYTDIAEEIDDDILTASQLKDKILLRTSAMTSINGYRDIFLKRIEQERSASYRQNLGYTFRALSDCFGDTLTFKHFNTQTLRMFESYLRNNGSSDTTINIRMSHVKAFINAAIVDGVAKFDTDIFAKYKAPEKAVRDICISKEEFIRLRDAEFSGIAKRRYTIARDMFMLSFYCGGINLTDLLSASLDGEYLTFIRKKTARSKRGEKRISITIQPEARQIIEKYIVDGRLSLNYHFSEYGQFRSFLTKSLNRIGEELKFEKKLMFYSARKTFCQFGFELGIPLYILEYAIGQTIKDANNRPIFNYIKIMREQADNAIRAIIDYSK
jgi:site-specific recombinase XerD